MASYLQINHKLPPVITLPRTRQKSQNQSLLKWQNRINSQTYYGQVCEGYTPSMTKIEREIKVQEVINFKYFTKKIIIFVVEGASSKNF